MQYTTKEYDKEKHDLFHALSVNQPYAYYLIKEEEKGKGVKYIELRSRNTKYRGEILICASKVPVISGLMNSYSLGFVELYDTKPVKEFTDEDWAGTCMPENERERFKSGYGWFMRNPRRAIEFPVKGQLGIFKLIYTKDLIIPYPQTIKLEIKDINANKR